MDRGGRDREAARRAGEIAHLPTVGPGGVAMPFTDVFAALGLHRPGSTAIDVPALLRGAGETAGDLARAVCGVLSAAVALADPAVVLLGGPWGPPLLDAVRDELAGAPRRIPVAAAAVHQEPALTGARESALEQLRDAIVAARSAVP